MKVLLYRRNSAAYSSQSPMIDINDVLVDLHAKKPPPAEILLVAPVLDDWSFAPSLREGGVESWRKAGSPGAINLKTAITSSPPKFLPLIQK